MSRQVGILLGILLAALGLLVLFPLLTGGTEGPGPEAEARPPIGPPLEPESGGEPGTIPGKGPTGEAAGRREALPPAPPGPGLLKLRIRRGDGLPARGEVSWLTSEEPPFPSHRLNPGGDPSKSGIRRVSHRGSALLPIPPGHWTWLRATSEGPPLLSAYERILPASGVQGKEIRLSGSTRGIHVFLLDGDYASPAPGREVRLYSRDMRAGGPPGLLRSEETDGTGYLRFRSLGPGAFLLCAPGARPGDPAPHCLAFVLPEDMPASEVTCTLVAAEETVRVRLEVDARFEKERGLQPRLFLRRWDDPVGGLYPMQDPLKPGKQEASIPVPPGEYGVEVLPLGRFDRVSGDPILRVRPAGNPRFEVALLDRKNRIEVELLGLSEKDLPVTVTPRPRGRILTASHGRMFCGPFRWRRTTERIAPPPGEVLLVVSGRNRQVWISAGIVPFVGPLVQVKLLPATKVLVSFTKRPGAGKSPIVTVRTRFGEEALCLRPMLLSAGGVDRPVYTGSIVVPEGRVRIEPWDASGGAWVREIQARGKVASVRIP